MAERKRSYSPSMIFDGLPDAIRNIRVRKNLQQAEAAARGGLEDKQSGKWSEYETRKKRLGLNELPIVLNGLGCTEVELWEEKIRVERLHYRQRAQEIGEERPSYESSPAAGYVESLYRLDVGRLPPDEQEWFNDFRNTVAGNVAGVLLTADRLIGRFRKLMNKQQQDA